MGKKLYNEEYINDIAIEIQKKLGTRDTFTLSHFAELVSKIGEPPEKDVNFYDYDGTRKYSYTKEEIMEMTSLPDLPDHIEEGLTNEGWNWSLADIKSMADPCVDVGCTYIPTDGHTRVHMDINKACTVPVSVYATTANTCYIDWGDGSERTPITTTSASSDPYSHEYAMPGKYIIEFIPSENDYICFGGTNTTFIHSSESRNSYIKGMVTKIFYGRNVKLYPGCMSPFSNLEILSLNKTVQIMGEAICGRGPNDRIVSGLHMKMLVIPKDFTLWGWQDFATLYADKVSVCSKITITNNVSATFFRIVNTSKIIFAMDKGVNRDVPFNGDGNLITQTKRLDVYFDRLVSCCGSLNAYVNVTDIYIQKSVSKPLWDNSNVNSNIRLHVPDIYYDDMMETSGWNTTFTGTVIPYESDWQDNYERLIHIPELIDGIWIDKWGNETEDSGCMATDYIPVTPGERIYMNSPHYSCTYNFYDSEQTRIAGGETIYLPSGCDADGGGHHIYVDAPSEAAFIRFSGGNSYGDPRMHWLEAWRKLN